jgi:hypothetical protein
MRKHFLTLVPLLCLIACDRQPAEPMLQAVHSTPALAGAADAGSLRVFRYQDAIGWCWSDNTNGLRVCQATFPLGGGTPEPDCGLQSEIAGAAYQTVTLPDGIRELNNAKGVVWITVRDLTRPGVCFGNQLVGEGWGTLHYTDNDGPGTADPNADAFGFMGSGTLTTPSGHTLQYSGHDRVTFSATHFHEDAQVNVH